MPVINANSPEKLARLAGIDDGPRFILVGPGSDELIAGSLVLSSADRNADVRRLSEEERRKS